MSTISLSPQATRTFTARPTRPVTGGAVRLTRRGKAVLLAGFLGLALVAMVVFGGLAVATRDAGTPEPVRVVQVQPGDTLYDIAGGVAEPGQVRAMVQRIEDLNALESSSLQVGQRLAVPRH